MDDSRRFQTILEFILADPHEVASVIQNTMASSVIWVNVRRTDVTPGPDPDTAFPLTTSTIDVRKDPRSGISVSGTIREAGDAVQIDEANADFDMGNNVAKFLILGAYFLSKSFFRNKDTAEYRQYDLKQLLLMLQRRWNGITDAVYGGEKWQH
jgi:hypothetical protein